MFLKVHLREQLCQEFLNPAWDWWVYSNHYDAKGLTKLAVQPDKIMVKLDDDSTFSSRVSDYCGIGRASVDNPLRSF